MAFNGKIVTLSVKKIRTNTKVPTLFTDTFRTLKTNVIDTRLDVVSGDSPTIFVNAAELLNFLQTVGTSEGLISEIGKVMAETAAGTDELVFSVGYAPVEDVSAAESVAKHVGVPYLADSVDRAEVVSLAPNKGVNEDASLTEVLSIHLGLILNDTVVVQDVFSRLTVENEHYADVSTTQEVLSQLLNKVLSDEAITDEIVKIYVRTPVSENITVAESGVSHIQDYFAEDYVEPGYTGTFYYF
jgi:hypothetical protein